MARFQNKVVLISGGARGQSVAEARLLLLGDDNSYITGAEVSIDCGVSL